MLAPLSTPGRFADEMGILSSRQKGESVGSPSVGGKKRQGEKSQSRSQQQSQQHSQQHSQNNHHCHCRHPPDSLVDRIVSSFDLPPQQIRQLTGHLVHQLRDGLNHSRPYQLPSYVATVPTGAESGHFLSVDLGGTNCRICLVHLRGDASFAVVQAKHAVPADVMVNASHRPLFAFVAARIRDFLAAHHSVTTPEKRLPLGFTFSFTCDQTSLRAGTLLHWDKGWDVPDAVGRDPVAMLQEAIDETELPVVVAALANDAVGTLMARAYASGAGVSTLAGVIFGTGTNAAYVEKLANIGRIEGSKDCAPDAVMVVNTEWGCLDDDMAVLPRTELDDQLDAESTDAGSQMLEKRVSGMYLGELFRLAVLRLIKGKALDLRLSEGSPARRPGGVSGEVLSTLVKGSEGTGKQLGVVEGTLTHRDVEALRRVAEAIGTRAGRLAGAALAAVIIQSGRLGKHDRVDVGADGSVIEFYPTFEADMRAAIREVYEIGEGEKRVGMVLTKDASAVGAALMAYAATVQGEL